jgi:hypothetical protein
MSVRRLLVSLGLVLVTSACAENLSSPTPVDVGPHFLHWAGTRQPRFSAIGAYSEHLIGGNSADGGVVAQAAVDQSSSATANASSLSWSQTVGKGANRLLVVGVSIRNANNPVSSVTYAGNALTLLQARNNDDGSVRVEQWYLLAPPSGTANVTVNLGNGGGKVVGGAVSFSGVDPVAPFRRPVSTGSTGTGTTNPAIGDSSGASELVLSTVATDGDAANTLTATAGQTQMWNRAYGTSGGDVVGGASTAAGTAGLTMGWSKGKNSKWALAAVAIKPYIANTLSLTTYQATFWAVNGQSRSVQINYSAGGGTAPFLKLTTTNPTYAPGKGNIAVGDSVLVTATVYPNTIGVDLEPTGLLFGTPASLTLWYGGAGGDLNGDGLVNAADSTIASQLLGMWYQEGTSNPWTSISATQSLTQQSFTTPLAHFSGYAVSW